MPLLMLMALTGGLYLFKDEINAALYRPLLTVEARAAAATPDEWAAAAAASGGRVVQLSPPAAEGRSALLVVETDEGVRRAVYVDPYDAAVLGATPDGGAMAVVKQLHSLAAAGPIANLAVEIAAGWAIVMVATGLVLWWPRGRPRGGVVTVRGGPKRRVFWRDLHAVTGLFAGGVIVFLAVTGMPWSAVWGQQARAMTNEAGWGRPPAPASAATWTHAEHGEDPSLPWALQDSALHAEHSDHAAGAAQAGLTLMDAVAGVDAAGLPRPYTLSLPAASGQAWTATHIPDDVNGMRTLYLDGASGAVLADIAYSDFGPAAQAIEWGISVHQGQQYGPVNKALMLAGCIAIWLLGVTALTMWWKRRPGGRIAAPPRPLDRRAYVALACVVAPLGVLYPLVGASIVAVLAIDFLARRIATAIRRAGAA